MASDPPVVALTTHLQKGIIASGIVLTIVNTVAIGLRLWSRRLLARSLEWSDYLILVSGIFVTTFWGVTISMVFLGGAGAEEIVWIEQPELQVFYFKSVIASTACWLVACYSCKLSVLILYHHLFSTAWGKKVTPVAVALTASFGISSILILLLVWRPISKWWDGTQSAAEEDEMSMASRYVDVATCLTDFFIYCLPVRTLWALKMDRKKRQGYILTFGVGFLTCVISLCRTLYNDLVSSNDEVQIMLGLEATFGIISACCPTVGPVYYTARGRSLDGNTPPSKRSSRAVRTDGDGNELVTIGRLKSGRSKHIYDTLRSVHKDIEAESQLGLSSKG